jgi:hypothetical protein
MTSGRRNCFRVFVPEIPPGVVTVEVVITRRNLLAAGSVAFGGGTVLGLGVSALAGCSDDSSPPFALARRFPNDVLVPGEVRLPVSLVRSGTVQASGPESLRGRVLDAANSEIAAVTAPRRDIDPQVPPYWAFRAMVPAAGVYTLRVDGDDGDGAAFEVFAADTVTMPHIGAVLRPFDTPTVDDHRGVEPYCSLTPQPCPLHGVTLRQALAAGAPLAYMVGTPAHCQTGTCAPGLEFLTATHARVGAAVTMVHADVFADNAGTVVSPAVSDLGLNYEPVVYLCAPDGTIVDQLDGVWDQTEIDEAVDRLIERFS